MKFLQLHERLRLETWRRIDQGVLSPSLLARQTGLGQPHISNFLHRRRHLSLAGLDRVLQAQALSVEDLSVSGIPMPSERSSLAKGDLVPIVSSAAAMTAAVLSARAILDTVQLPAGWLAGFPARRAISRRSWERFVAVRITAAQSLAMDPFLRVGTVVVLDRHYNSLSALTPTRPNLYGVRLGIHLVFRHVIFEASRLILRPRAVESALDVIELTPQESPSDLIVGRVCLCLAEP